MATQEERCPETQPDLGAKQPAEGISDTQANDEPNHPAMDGSERDPGHSEHPFFTPALDSTQGLVAVMVCGYANEGSGESHDRPQRGSSECTSETSTETSPRYFHSVHRIEFGWAQVGDSVCFRYFS
jgi:hypothetical protein